MIEENSNMEFEKREIEYRSKKRFHSHHAIVYEYKFSDGTWQTEFWSYSTPILVKIGDSIYENSKWYSSTTTRQKNRFLRERDWDMSGKKLYEEYKLRNLCIW